MEKVEIKIPNRHCGRGPAIQAVYKRKNLINRLDPGSMSGMTTKKAFTLIELLVVVLIIGILSAIALPQYQKAVVKSRIAEAQTMLSSLMQAQEAYYLANGIYTNNINELDVQVPAERIAGSLWGSDENHPTQWMYSCDKTLGCAANTADSNLPFLTYTGNSTMYAYNSRAPESSGKEYLHVCGCTATSPSARCQICKTLSGKSNPDFAYYNQYLYILP